MASLDPSLVDADRYTHGFPHSVFRELRANNPVSWQLDGSGGGFWAVTRHADVLEVLRAPRIFSSWRGGALLADPPAEFLAKLRQGLLNRDPPDHTLLRRLVNKAFTPKRIAALDATIAAHAHALVASVRDAGRCDYAREIAGEMPLFLICEVLGVPNADRRRLYGLTERMFGSELVDPQAAFADGMAAANELRAYGDELLRERAAAPREDMSSDLVTAEVDGRRLTPGELQAFFMLLFNAGADTTRSLLAFGLELLLAHPEAMAQLRADPSRLPAAIEEVLRFESPVIQFRRTAACDTVLAATRIREGDKVLVFFPSANRDETVFDDPDRFAIERTPNDHLAFGHGSHFCLGAPLARLESLHVFRATLAQLDDIEPTGPTVYSRTNFIRSVRQLPIRFRAVG